jgi:hypothetical protein
MLLIELCYSTKEGITKHGKEKISEFALFLSKEIAQKHRQSIAAGPCRCSDHRRTGDAGFMGNW